MSPSGTTINLFDYWITERDANDAALKGNAADYSDDVYGDEGINAGRQLKFTPGSTQNHQFANFNRWTGDWKGTPAGAKKGIVPCDGMVQNELVNGYPSLKRNTGIGINSDESLAYLFDASKQDGKKSFFGTTGLLQQVKGYYEYNSADNFASFNEDANSFTVYDKPAIYQSKFEGGLGQFFPFYSGDQVFDSNGDELVAKEIESRGREKNGDGTGDQVLKPTNHYFGLSMSSRFIQPQGGKTNSGDDMVFEFTGDDDVWVFIDGVLVGDLGGNHSAASLKINFASGEVIVNDGTDAKTTKKLSDCFKGTSVSPTWNGDTFADGTQHTLDFFYLERGNVDSNMRLKFNLVTIPVSEVYKVDQDGDPVADAHFALYAAEGNKDGEWAKKDDNAIADGRTDPTGQLILTSQTTREVLTFKELAKKYNTNKFILTEDSAPNGYGSNLGQTGDSIYLEYVEIADENSPTVKSGIVVDRGGTGPHSLIWQNGAFTSTKETVTATDPINYVDHSGEVTEKDLKDGLLFAVVLKRDKTDGGTPTTDAWHAVYGDPLDGYKVQQGAGIEDVIAAAKADGANASILRLNSSGQYQTEIENLPGDITKYYFVLPNDKKADAEYAVGFYFAKGVKSLDQATSSNTKRVNGDGFIREFSARANVSNTFNRLYVQKDDGTVNADGTCNYIAGAEFTLYKADENNVTTDEDGKPALKPNAQPYDTVTTVDELTDEKVAKLEGAAVFPSSEKGVLENGTYYLKETKAPAGYKINDTLIKVIVSDEGVFADAGSENDGVRTSVGVGKLMKTMAQFGAANEINSTLTYIKGSLQTAVEANGKLTWGAASTDADKILNLSYAANDALLEYGPVTEGGPVAIESETGWNRLLIQQDDVPAGATSTGNRTELGNQALNALFSGSTSVIVSDEEAARLEVKKTVQKENGREPNPDTKFDFQFDLPYDGGRTYVARVFDKDGNVVKEGDKVLEYELSSSGKIISIKAGQIIRVYGLKDNEHYTVTELTKNGTKPEGFTLVGRKQGGADYNKDEAGADISGTVEAIGDDGAMPIANKLEFINEYKVTPVDLPASATFSVKKILTTNPADRKWQDGDEFTISLTGKENAPLPKGATNSVYTVTLTKNKQEYEFGNPNSDDTKITYTKPGVYNYKISEETGSKPGMTYSDALYTVAVDVRDKGDGTLYVAKVTMNQVHADGKDDESISETNPKLICEISWVDEDGKLLESPAVEPKNSKPIAEITNTYAEKTQSVAIIPHKTFTHDGVSEYDFASADFKAMLKAKAVDNVEQKASEAPLPSGEKDADGWITHEFSGQDHSATFGAIQFNSDEHMGRSYTYLVKEYIPNGVDSNKVLDGMKYDPAVYEVTYAVDKNFDKEGNLQVSVSWKKDGVDQEAPENGELTIRPEFTNIYTVTPITAAGPQAQKTLKGRPWRTDDSFTFTLEAADGTDTGGISNWGAFNKTITLRGKDASTTNPVQFYFATEEQGGQQVPVQLTFTKAGTYTFNIKETTDGDAATNAQKKGLTLDGHTATVTYVVTDLINGKHTGVLTVTGPTYTNERASAEDAKKTDIAAFTNEYKAAGNNGAGVSLTKVLHGKAMTNGMFSFTISKVSADALGNYSQTATVDSAAKNEGDTWTWTKENLLKLNFTQADLGKTYVYSVVENDVNDEHPGYGYDTKYKGTAYVYMTVKAKQDNESELYAETVVVKGAGARGDYTQEELENLQSANDRYVQRHDSSQETSDTNKAATVPFENTYKASFNYTANGGLDLSKTFTSATGGSASSTFYFKVTPQDTIVSGDEGETTTITTAKDAAGKLDLNESGSTFQIGPVSLGNTASTSVLSSEPGKSVVFTQADGGKTYTYQVEEVTSKGETPADGTPAGYTYDKTVYTVTISVVDNNNGTLTVTITVTKPGEGGAQQTVSWAKVTTNGAAGDSENKVATVPFANTYTTKPATADLKVKKQTSGRAETDKEFSFTLKATAGDSTTGVLSSITAIENEDIVDKDGKEITLSDSNVIKSDAKTSGTIKENQPQSVDLTSLKFNKVGTYQFVVTENYGKDADASKDGIQNDGWTMDGRVHTVTVTVTDKNSQLEAEMTWDANNGGDTFNNTYGATVAYGGINVTKTLTGRTLRAGDFEFEIKGVDGPAGTGATADEANEKLTDADEKFSNVAPTGNDKKVAMSKLNGISFDEKDAGKTFVYEVRETKGGSPEATAEKPNGYTNDERTYVVSIKVNDDGEGHLSTVTTVKVEGAEVEGKTYQNGAVAEVPFENFYRSTGSLGGDAKAKIEADKTLTGRDMDGDEFAFEVTAKDKDGKPVAGIVTSGANAKAEDGQPGAITFGEIVYSNLSATDKDFPKAGEGQTVVSLPDAVTDGLATPGATADGKDTYTFHYTVSEKTSDENGKSVLPGGVTADGATSFDITVVVTDNNDGTLTAVVTYPAGTSKLSFMNKYEAAETKAQLEVTKNLTGREWKEGDSFTFVLSPNLEHDATKLAWNAKKIMLSGGEAAKTESETIAYDSNNPTAAKSATFGAITFKQAGTYQFYITEQAPDGATVSADKKTAYKDGVTYDLVGKVVTVEVVDNLDGTMTARGANGAKLETTITNTYAVTGTASATPQVTKTVTGRDSNTDFTFILKAMTDYGGKVKVDGANLGMAEKTATVVGANGEIKNGQTSAAANFPELTFNAIGDYEFTISEKGPANKGWECKTGSQTVTYEVTDNLSGGFDVAVKPEGAVNFRNEYKLAGDSNGVAPKVTKKVTGGDANGKTFEFVLAPAENQPIDHIEGLGKDDTLKVRTEGDIEDGKTQELTFGNLKFDAEGEYRFTITEATESGDGWTCDNASRELVILVADNGQGGLKAKVESGDNLTITNIYAADGELDGGANLKVTKVIDGRNWIEGDTFEFVLTHNNDVTKQAIADKKVVLPGGGADAELNIGAEDVVNGAYSKAFGNIKFTEEGEYEFKITETPGNIAGLTYDTSERVVKVKVTDPDSNGRLKVEIVDSSANPTFTNKYGSKNEATASTDGLFSKSINGRDWLDTDTFSFTLSAVTPNAPMPTDTTVEVKAPKDKTKAQSFGFGSIEFKWDDIKDADPAEDGSRTKTFEYQVTENDTSIPGITKDGKVATVKITVTDNGKGQLTASKPVVTEVANGAFVNTYKPAAASVTLVANKTLSGRPLKDGEFAFQLLNADGKTELQTKNNAGGKVTFDPITYTEVGEHDYIIKEVKGTLGGVTYDTTEHKVHVIVTDDTANGKLVATVTYDGESGAPTITNAYAAKPATDTPSVSKTVEPTAGNKFEVKDGQFSFTLKNTVNASGAPDADQTITNVANGNAAFTALNFPVAGTYVYTLTENNIDAEATPGVHKDATVYTITYVVKDVDQNGKLTITSKTVTAEGKETSNNTEGIAFTNTYNPTEAAYNITGKKTIKNVDLKTDRVPMDGEFTFKLTAVDGAPMPEGSKADETGVMVKTVTNTGFSFDFGKMAYTKPGDYVYTVTEVAGSDPTIGYSKQSYQVTVHVSDKGGALTAMSSVAIDGQPATNGVTFTNTYTPTPATLPGKTSFRGTKTLTGRDLNEGEFTFELKDANGNVLQTATNAADGSFAFPDSIKFDHVGIYTYTITEKTDNKLGGVTYDAKVVTVTVTVTENAATHELKAEVAYSVEGNQVDKVVFENAYKATIPADITLKAIKVLEGRKLTDGEFRFELREDDKVLQTKTNAADGTVTFDPISYTEAGEHNYTIVEVKGNDSNITYDKTIYHVHVVVTDNGKGALEATSTITKVDEEGNETPAEEIIFHNFYQAPPTPPDPDKPDPDPDPKPDPDPDPTPDPDPDPNPNPGPDPDKPVKPSEPDNPAKPDKPELPQTGDSAPSPIALGAMATAGVGLIGCGAVLAKRSRRK